MAHLGGRGAEKHQWAAAPRISIALTRVHRFLARAEPRDELVPLGAVPAFSKCHMMDQPGVLDTGTLHARSTCTPYMGL